MPAREHKIDPLLTKHIIKAGHTDELMAIFYIEDGSGQPFKAKEVAEVTEALLTRVREKIGLRESQLMVFGKYSAFAIKAKHQLLNEIIRQPEVVSAEDNNPELDD